MAQESIEKLVYRRCPFLTDPASDALIQGFVQDTYYEFYELLGIDSADVEDDTKYTGVARLFIADVASIAICRNEATKNTAGASGGAPNNKVLKKAQAGKGGAASVEWEVPKSKDGSLLTVDFDSLIKILTRDANRRARKLGIRYDLATMTQQELDIDTPNAGPFIIPFD